MNVEADIESTLNEKTQTGCKTKEPTIMKMSKL